jgi:PiT family inorganic phosphate transporter
VTLAILIAVVVIALAFDYTNGFHDAANAIATSVSTRALTPRVALTLAAVMNFVGALLGQEVAHTVSDVLKLQAGDTRHALVIVLAALLGAIVWNLITWYFGLPSSSSHALIGALVGAALAAGSAYAVVHWATIVDKVLLPMVISPVVGLVLAFLVMLAIMWIFRRRNPHRVFRGFRMMQTVSAPRSPSGTACRTRRRRWASSSWR